MALGLLIDPVYRRHLEGVPGHPECPERIDAVMRALEAADLIRGSERVDTRVITEDELLLCHTADYLRIAKRDVEAGIPYLSTGDTDLTPNSWLIASLAAGGALNAVDAVMTGAVQSAFCAVRPPGHHATPSRGMGFCIFNHIAIAARYAQRKQARNDPHPRLGRPPRQRHPGRLLRRPLRPLLLLPPMAALSRHRPPQRKGRRPRPRLHHQLPTSRRLRLHRNLARTRHHLAPDLDEFSPNLF